MTDEEDFLDKYWPDSEIEETSDDSSALSSQEAYDDDLNTNAAKRSSINKKKDSDKKSSGKSDKDAAKKKGGKAKGARRDSIAPSKTKEKGKTKEKKEGKKSDAGKGARRDSISPAKGKSPKKGKGKEKTAGKKGEEQTKDAKGKEKAKKKAGDKTPDGKLKAAKGKKAKKSKSEDKTEDTEKKAGGETADKKKKSPKKAKKASGDDQSDLESEDGKPKEPKKKDTKTKGKKEEGKDTKRKGKKEDEKDKKGTNKKKGGKGKKKPTKKDSIESDGESEIGSEPKKKKSESKTKAAKATGGKTKAAKATGSKSKTTKATGSKTKVAKAIGSLTKLAKATGRKKKTAKETDIEEESPGNDETDDEGDSLMTDGSAMSLDTTDGSVMSVDTTGGSDMSVDTIDDSVMSVDNTGGSVIERLGWAKFPSFSMEEGSIDMQQALAAVGGPQENLSNSSSITSLDSVSSYGVSPPKQKDQKGKSETKQLSELAALHRQMLDMQSMNYELTSSVAKAGAATAEAVRLLLAGGPVGPPGRGGPMSPSDFYDGRRPGEIPKFEPKTVRVKVAFLRIIDIDTIAQRFEAEIYIEARWLEKQFKGLSLKGLSAIEFFQCWDPRLKLLNVVGDLDMEKTSMVLRYEPDSISPVLVYMWHVRGTFRERMELQHFPFDVQEMSVVLSSDLPADYLDLVEDPNHDSLVNLGAMQESDEWKNYRHVEFTRDMTTQEMESTSKHPVLVVAAHVKRKLGSYFWNIVVIVFLILALTFTLLAVDPTSTDRLTIIMTLLLTTVAFKLVARSSLPPIAYLTYLDIYIVFTMTYLFLQGAESAMMIHLAKYKEPQHVRHYDEIAQSCLIAFLILFHLIFIIYIELTVLGRRRRMIRMDLDFKLARLKKKRERMERREAADLAAYTRANA